MLRAWLRINSPGSSDDPSHKLGREHLAHCLPKSHPPEWQLVMTRLILPLTLTSWGLDIPILSPLPWGHPHEGPGDTWDCRSFWFNYFHKDPRGCCVIVRGPGAPESMIPGFQSVDLGPMILLLIICVAVFLSCVLAQWSAALRPSGHCCTWGPAMCVRREGKSLGGPMTKTSIPSW